MKRTIRSTRSRRAIALVGLAAAALAVLAPTSAGAAGTRKPRYPVPYTFVPDVLNASKGPNTPPPGSNIWTCKPSKARPNPVILVHGLLANQTDNWQTYGPLLADNGYCVFSLTYGNSNGGFTGGLAPMPQSAHVLGRFVDRVLKATHARKVDIVGHSEGATMPYWYLKFDGGAAEVAKMVGLSPVVHGTDVAKLSMLASQADAFGFSRTSAAKASGGCAACDEFNPDSSFIRKLDKGGITVPGVTYTQVVTDYDELVVPYTSGIVAGARSTNFVIQHQCPTDTVEHVAMAVDPAVARDVLNALDPAHRKPVVCAPAVAPVIGAPIS